MQRRLSDRKEIALLEHGHEFEPEAAIRDSREKLAPALRRGADEIVLRSRPILDREGEAGRSRLFDQTVREVGEVVIVGLLARIVVTSRKDHEDREALAEQIEDELDALFAVIRTGEREYDEEAPEDDPPGWPDL